MKKNIIIGTGISIASIIGGYYLTKYGARRYIQHQEHKIFSETLEKMNSFSQENEQNKIVFEGILKIIDFKMKHRKLYKFVYQNKCRCEPMLQPLLSMKHMM